jgi:hypothetical protein
MGSSPRLFGLGSRQDGKRFPGCLKSRARPSLSRRWSFFMEQNWNSMNEQRSFRIYLVILALCLISGNLVILPGRNVASLSAPERFSVEAENESLLDECEPEEAFLLAAIIGAISADLFFSKPRIKNLDFQTTYFSPASPPPRHS